MSLVKQLWLALTLLMGATFCTSLAIHAHFLRDYLQQQLQVKNIDNAHSLALTLTQMDKDPAAIELLVSAQFDIGHYRFIRITSPAGQPLVERSWQGQQTEEVPGWFVKLIPIRAEAGQAQIQDGWKQYGTLSLASQEQYVYRSLWDSTRELLAWFLLGGLAAGALGTLVLRLVTRPLLDIVAQAQALSQRRFQTMAEPRTPELRAVSRAMNDMVARLKASVAEEAERLEALRERLNRDSVSGLASREGFLSQLREFLDAAQPQAPGQLALVELCGLDRLNARLGHQRVDQLIGSLGQALEDGRHEHAGRLKGGEFAVICPGDGPPATTAQALHARLLRDWLPQWQADSPDLFHLAVVPCLRHESAGALLARADQALAQARAKGPNSWHAADDGGPALPAGQWRRLLGEAPTTGQLSLDCRPVVETGSGRLLHHEAMLRLQPAPGSPSLAAAEFMPVAAQLDLSAPLDLALLRLALERLRVLPDGLALRLAPETIADLGSRHQLLALLQQQPGLCPRLLFELPEYGVWHHFDAFRDLAQRLQALGCRVGLAHFGRSLLGSERLAGLGLDYVRLDPACLGDLGRQPASQEFLTGLCAMAHDLGLRVIAPGVADAAMLPLLGQLGFDGVAGTGPGGPATG
ncbi:MAG: hypothetical protein RJA36_341 [Pseudomonadota bacterium]|jgi:predicted signal transduction protein with EAL and GGDEF domain